MLFNRAGNNHFVIRGVDVEAIGNNEFLLNLTGPKKDDLGRLDALAQSLVERFGKDVEGHFVTKGALKVAVKGMALDYISRLRSAPHRIEVEKVQPASDVAWRVGGHGP